MTNTIQTAKELTFGTELEYTNISRERAVKAIHSVVGGTIRYTGGGYDEWTVVAPDGRHWKAVSDGSLGSRSTSAEVVTPILKWDDMDTLQSRGFSTSRKSLSSRRPERSSGESTATHGAPIANSSPGWKKPSPPPGKRSTRHGSDTPTRIPLTTIPCGTMRST